MKYFCTLMILLLFAGCRKNADSPVYPDHSTIKIKSIVGNGQSWQFTYDNDLLATINGEKLIYKNGKLHSSVRVAADTTYIVFNGPPKDSTQQVFIKKARYSYVWETNQLLKVMADTLLTQQYTNGKLTNESLNLNIHQASFFYNQQRLDSMASFSAPNPADYSLISGTFEYDNQENITQETGLASFASGIPYPGTPTQLKVSTTYEYDNHPNPFYILYKQIGFPWRGINQCISKNNPVKTSFTTVGSIPLSDQKTIRYEYNGQGLPVKMSYEVRLLSGDKQTVSYTITYY